jgi:hypothetical protein
MSRKPIQIAVTPDHELYALCDDGTIWVHGTSGWDEVEAIPREPGEPMAPEVIPAPSMWPPESLLGLWAERPSGTLVRIYDDKALKFATRHGWRFLEAGSEEDAKIVARSRDRFRFRHNGVEYQYTPAIPF